MTTFLGEQQRLQVDSLELLIRNTASRPGDLVYVRRNEKRINGHCIGENDEEEENEYKTDNGWGNGDDKTLCYRGITLLLLPNPESI
jgi:hypothetical protein